MIIKHIIRVGFSLISIRADLFIASANLQNCLSLQRKTDMRSDSSKSIKSNSSALHLPTNKQNGTQISSSSNVKYFVSTLDRQLAWVTKSKPKETKFYA